MTKAQTGVTLTLFAVVLCGTTAQSLVHRRQRHEPAPAAHGPVVIESKVDRTFSHLVISNADGPCLEIRNAKNVTIEDARIGPCGGHGINISGSSDVVIRRSRIIDTRGNGVNVYQTDGLKVTGNRIERNSSGVYVHRGTQIQVRGNKFRDVFGPTPRGQFVQFNEVTGRHSSIVCNTGTNSPGKSAPEDAINVFSSHGVPDDPILVTGNRISGGGPSRYGGGILLGDGGGSWQIAQDNVVVDPGQYGIAVASGQNMVIRDNVVYARSQPFTNVGIYVWNQYKSECAAITVTGNIVEWWGNDGQRNSGWDARNCGPVRDWDRNVWNAVIDGDLLAHAGKACAE